MSTGTTVLIRKQHSITVLIVVQSNTIQKKPGAKAPLCVDKDPYKGRYVCGICNQEIMITPKLQNGAFTWRAVCPHCGTLMAYRGERESLVEQATKKFYIKPVETLDK